MTEVKYQEFNLATLKGGIFGVDTTKIGNHSKAVRLHIDDIDSSKVYQVVKIGSSNGTYGETAYMIIKSDTKFKVELPEGADEADYDLTKGIIGVPSMWVGLIESLSKDEKTVELIRQGRVGVQMIPFVSKKYNQTSYNFKFVELKPIDEVPTIDVEDLMNN